jgi:ribosome-associated protein
MRKVPRTRKKPSSQPARRVARLAADLMLSKKATDVVLLDIAELSGAADFFVIGSASTDVQVRAVSEAVVEGLEEAGIRINHVEGFTERRWVLIDCIDVVVHVFLDDLREFYALERLWGDARLEKIEG